MNKQAQFNLMIGIFLAVIALFILITMLPMFSDLLDVGKTASYLNCNDGSDYNATRGEKSALACTGFDLFLPILVIAFLVAIVSYIIYQRSNNQQPDIYGG
jgi:hypothetical protein